MNMNTPYDSLVDVSYLLTSDDLVIDVNSSFLDMFGYSKADLKGRHIINVLNEILKANYNFNIQDQKEDIECFIFTKSDEAREVNISLIDNFDKKERKYLFVEKANSRLIDKFPYVERMCLDNITGIGIYLQDLTLVKLNNEYLSCFIENFKSYEYCIGRKMSDLFLDYEGSPLEQVMNKIISTGASHYIEEAESSFSKREKAYLKTSFIPILENGKVKYIINAATDITEMVLNRKRIEEQNKIIQQQKEQLEAIIENMSDALLVFDKDGKYTNLNKSAREVFLSLYGNYSEKLYNVDFYDENNVILPPGSFPVRRVLNGEKLTRYKMKMKSKDNTVHTEISGTPVYDKDGAFIAGILCCRDVTEETKIKENLKENEVKYQMLFNNMELGCAYYKIIINEQGNPVDYIITDLNPAYEKITEYSRANLIGKKATEGKPENVSSRISRIKLFGEVALTGKAFTLERYSDRVDKWYSVSYYCPKPGYCASIFSDITLRKRNEINLEKTKQRLLESQELAKMGDWEYDIIKEQSYWGDGLFRLLGHEPQEFLTDKNTHLKFIHTDDRELYEKQLPDLYSGLIDHIDFRYVRADKEIHHGTSIVKRIFDDEGKLIKLTGTIQDVTGTYSLHEELVKAKETAEKANQVKSEYIANMSHEFRTPLNVLLGGIQLIESYFHGDNVTNIKKASHHLTAMKQNCLRIIRLVNNLIDTSIIDAGFLKPRLRNYDIVNVIKDITCSVEQFARFKDIKLSFKTEMEEKIISCDVDFIERVLFNILSNSIKFTDRNGYIKVSISENNDKVYISIKDNGIGIPEDKLEMIFERYRQVNNTLTRQYEGSGIGLTLARSLVEMLEGRIGVRSKLGHGSEFIIELPLKIIEQDKIEDQEDKHISFVKTSIERMKVEFSDIYTS